MTAVTALALCLFAAVSVYLVLQYRANLSGANPRTAVEDAIRSVLVYCLLELPLLWATGTVALLFHWPRRFACAYLLVILGVWSMTLALALIAAGLGSLVLPVPVVTSLGLLAYAWAFEGVARLVIGFLGLSGLFSSALVLALLL